jgi:murein DD-endopeptidase MepM/ murein hydrolase activator NlpD
MAGGESNVASQNRRMPLFRRLTTGLVVLALTLPMVTTAKADTQTDINQAQQQLNDLRAKSANAQTEMAKVSAQAEVAQAELNQAEGELASASAAYQTIADETVQATNHLKRVEVDLKATEEHMAQRKEVVAGRLRSLQEQGRISYLEVIFGAASFNDFISRLDLIGAIVRKDREVFDGVKKEKEQLDQQKQEAAARKIQLETLSAQALAKQQEVEQRKNDREVATRSLNTSRRRLQEQLDALDQAAEQMNAKIAELQAQMQTPVSAEGFHPGLPVPSPWMVTSLFGPRLHPVLHIWRPHTGVDFNAPYGSPILAVESGVVIMASYDEGYGNYIVIDHGGGIATKYGHNSQLLVQVGQKVTKGQQIARAGATGYATGPHNHVEIIVNGEFRNFLDYIPASWYTLNLDA